MTEWHKLHDVALFLSCFRMPHTLVEVVEIVPWREFLRWEPEQVLDRLMAEGLLEPAEPDEPLGQRLLRLTVPDLQALSKERGLPVSRAKEELIAQLIDRDREAMEQVALHRTLIRCTDEGTAAAERYLAEGAQTLRQQTTVPLQLARKLIKWILLAAAGGIIGEAAYDGLKALVNRLSEEAEIEDVVRQPFEPELVHVPAGPFLMGTSDEQIRYMVRHFDWARKRKEDELFENEQPQHTVTLPAYYIGRYPVTHVEYHAFVTATGHDVPLVWRLSRPPSDPTRHPVTGVSWRDAQDYVKWLRQQTGRPYRLPTEAEWEKAARGDDGRIWPWGNNWDSKRCNSSESGAKGTTPVDQYSPLGDSPYGCADMAGNAWEWTQSRWGRSWRELDFKYPYDPNDGREDIDSHDRRMTRGGAYVARPYEARCAWRDWSNPGYRYNLIGFRVVAAPVPLDSEPLDSGEGDIPLPRSARRGHARFTGANVER